MLRHVLDEVPFEILPPTLTAGPNQRFSISDSWGEWLRNRRNPSFRASGQVLDEGPFEKLPDSLLPLNARDASSIYSIIFFHLFDQTWFYNDLYDPGM